VASLGAVVWQGDLDDLDGLGAAAREADGVIHLAFKHDEQYSGNLAGAIAADLRAIEAMGASLTGTDKPFIGTNATGAMALAGFAGRLTEHDTLPGGGRMDAENTLIAFAGQGVRSSVVGLPPAVHSLGRYSFVSGLIDIARATGISGYLGEGSNRRPATDTRDVARVYRLALEHAATGSRLHAVAEEGITIREIAATIGRLLDVPVAPVATGDAERHFSYLSAFVGLDNPTSSQITRDTLGWTPTRPGLISDLEQDRDLAVKAD
jgi:nucleoside-diphosphate-sugar epimerase